MVFSIVDDSSTEMRETLFVKLLPVAGIDLGASVHTATIDFSDGLNGKGFVFVNPNATNTCGCGESFSIS